MAPLVVFRADGGPVLGGGHVMRCLSLAAEFVSSGWQVAFATTRESLNALPALGASSYELLIVDGTAAEEAQQIGLKWSNGNPLLVVDHYGRDFEFEQECRNWANRILVIDDLVNRKHDADLLIDSGAASAELYSGLVPATCQILAGPSYAMLHPGFLLAREAAWSRRDGRAVARILVTMGQMDPDNATALALDAIEASGFSGAVDVVLGQAALHLAAIRRRAKGKINLHVNSTNMPALMATSDLSIGAGGVTALERCSVGLPSIVIETADNQRAQVEILAEKGAIAAAGKQLDLGAQALTETLRDLLADAEKRMHMAAAAAALVDGRGVERIVLAATQ